MTANDVAAVLFDFGGTLDADGLPWKERVFRLFAEEGVVVTRERFDPLFYTADDALVGTIPRTSSFGETVARLARRYRLGIVSNFYGNLARVCEDVGIGSLFSVLVDSAEVGCAKPDPRIFRVALDALGVGPAAATFVGDSLPRDMAGARAVGMRHIWLVGATAPAAESCCGGDRQIRSLGELEAILL